MRLSLDMGLGSIVTMGTGVAGPPGFLGSSLLAWWTADRADLITLSGNQVTSWKDVVGAYNAVQAVGGSRPLYSSTSFNGVPGITSDATDDELTVAPVPASIPTGANPVEIWCIVSQDLPAGTAGVRFFAAYGGGANFRRTAGRAVAGTNVADARAGTGAAEVSVAPAGDFTGRHVVRVRFTASLVGITVDNGTEVTTAVALGGTTNDRLRLFSSATATASAFWGGIGRDCLYTLPLTAPQAAAMWSWALPRRIP